MGVHGAGERRSGRAGNMGVYGGGERREVRGTWGCTGQERGREEERGKGEEGGSVE